ncbi:MAG TPA: phytanoyl-CoA dioxygenase family protein [Chthonomonadaceae bacterium]|nr:phytanoyl-CoA dioxygenase family protein [Chthonomonadaceae bacterium]
MAILTEEDRAFFEENGYVVVLDVVPKENCEAVINALFEFLGMDRNNPEDWYRPPLKTGGMIEIYQHQALWNNRQYPRLHQVYSEIWGMEQLCVTIDRAGFKPPQHPDHPEFDHKGFAHWDVDTSKLPIRFGVQGVLCLSDTEPGMGGFQCVPGFHRGLEEWIRTLPPDRNPRVPDLSTLPPDKRVVPIPAKQGSLIIWNNLLLHGNGHNVSKQPRFSQYISMFPASRLMEETRQARIAQWRDHTPPYTQTFPGDPRKIEEQFGTTAELTPLGRKLLGLDPWD